MLSEFAAGRALKPHKSETSYSTVIQWYYASNIASVRKIKPMSVISEDVSLQKERHMQVAMTNHCTISFLCNVVVIIGVCYIRVFISIRPNCKRISLEISRHIWRNFVRLLLKGNGVMRDHMRSYAHPRLGYLVMLWLTLNSKLYRAVFWLA